MFIRKVVPGVLLLSVVLAGCLGNDMDPVEAPEWTSGRVAEYDAGMTIAFKGKSQISDDPPQTYEIEQEVSFRMIEEVLNTSLMVGDEPAYLVAVTMVSDEDGLLEALGELPVGVSAVRQSDHTPVEASLAPGGCSDPCTLEDALVMEPFAEHPLLDFPLTLDASWIAEDVSPNFEVDTTTSGDPFAPDGPAQAQPQIGHMTTAKVTGSKHVDHPVVGATDVVVIDYSMTFKDLESIEQDFRRGIEMMGGQVDHVDMDMHASFVVEYGVEPGVVLSVSDYVVKSELDYQVTLGDMEENGNMVTTFTLVFDLVEYRDEPAPERGTDYVRALLDGLLPVGVSAEVDEPPVYEVAIVADPDPVTAGEQVTFALESTGASLPDSHLVTWSLLDHEGEEVASETTDGSTDFTHQFGPSGPYWLTASVLDPERGEIAGDALWVPAHYRDTVQVGCPMVTTEALDMTCSGHTFPVKAGAYQLVATAESESLLPTGSELRLMDPSGNVVEAAAAGESIEVDLDSSDAGDWSVEFVHELGVMENVEYHVSVLYAGLEDPPEPVADPEGTIPQSGQPLPLPGIGVPAEWTTWTAGRLPDVFALAPR